MKYLLLILLVSCSVVKNEPQTIIKGKKHRLIKGNAKHFQQRHDRSIKKVVALGYGKGS